ncbi:hypothetical protein ACMD2_18074 [Ananas comosus]|uniref:Uncharacterized protein n=1 Tax=Ananas comosus TaxID=4615 RepID=A0A199UEP3_ANACO|nr:hypothetical protein ACMD2_18074 [Ananas comosus]
MPAKQLAKPIAAQIRAFLASSPLPNSCLSRLVVATASHQEVEAAPPSGPTASPLYFEGKNSPVAGGGEGGRRAGEKHFEADASRRIYPFSGMLSTKKLKKSACGPIARLHFVSFCL